METITQTPQDIQSPIQKEEPINQKKYIKHDGPEVTYVLTKKNGSQQTVTYKKKKYISPEMIEDMKNMLANKCKRKDICAKYNITLPTLKKYIG